MSSMNIGSVVADISEREFNLFRKFMLAASGVDLGPTKRALVQSRLSRRIAQLGLGSFGDYWNVVSGPQSSAERQFVINALSTNETYFFREMPHFQWLAERVQKHLQHSKRPFRVWSAACSSGEEAYTLAIVLKEACANRGEFEVLATDINTAVLREARRAVYPRARAQKVPVHLLHRYFMFGNEEYRDMLRVVPELTAHVRFEQYNLLGQSTAAIGEFDVVFLRNVMIYFNEDTKIGVLDTVSRHLRDDGQLVISHSETLNGLQTDLVAVSPSIYKRRPRNGDGK